MSQKKTFEQKSKSSKELYANYLDKMIKSGKSISQIKRMNVKQWQKVFGKHGRLKKSSLEAKKRVIVGQLTKDVNQVVSYYIDKQHIQNNDYKTFLYNQSYKLLRVKKEEIKKVNELEYEPVKKKGQYATVKVIDLKNEHEYYIKYTNEKDLKKNLESLKTKYKITSYYTQFLGTYMYKKYITEEFKKRLSKLKIMS